MHRLHLPMLLLCAAFALLAFACGNSSDSPASGGSSGGGGGGGGGTGNPIGSEPLVLVTPALPAATIGVAYNFKVTATGGAPIKTWRIAGGAFSNGLVFSTSTGIISGTPRVTGTWPVRLEITDGTNTVARDFSMLVASLPGDPALETQLRTLLAFNAVQGLGPANIPVLNQDQVDLGRLLFFEKELSGHRDVACATCHHPTLNMGDGLNLSVGAGATGGIGPGRDHPAKVFIPRHAPPLFNMAQMLSLFWDKRVFTNPPGPTPTFTPEGWVNLPTLEAQALLPLVDISEMRGTGHSLDGLTNDEYREALVQRLAQFPEYVQRFDAAFGPGGMTVNNMVRAIAAYERSLTFVDSPYDRYLRGDNDAMTDPQKRGALVFFGRGTCVQCHAGPLLTNMVAFNVGTPQFGPGVGNGPSGREDFGFENVSGDPLDRYGFRVPPLRNVVFTAPYMHNGALHDLDEVMLHYKEKAINTNMFNGMFMVQAADLASTLLPTNLVTANMSLPFLFVPDNFTPQETIDVIAFLEALTDPDAINRTSEIPAALPSGLPLDR